MAVDFNIKSEDTLPPIQATLELNGVPVNLSGCTVRFIMTDKASGTVKVDATATVVNSATGVVRYDWIQADTDTPGTYNGEFEMQDGSGHFETFPNTKHIQIKIIADLGGVI